MTLATSATDYQALADIDLDTLARARDERAVFELTRRYNQRLLRTAWSILKSHQDAEEAVQDAYIKAFTSAASFSGASSYATWLTRIVINESVERRRNAARRSRLLAKDGIGDLGDASVLRENAPISQQTPEQALARSHLATQLLSAIAKLNDTLRPVFVMREMNGESIADTAELLGLSQAAVKSRHLRARQQLQEILAPEFQLFIDEDQTFGGDRCLHLSQSLLSRMFAHP